MGTRGFGLSVVALGAVYFALTLELPMRTLNGPGPGVFPLLVAGILVLAGALAAWKPETEPAAEGEEVPPGSFGAVGLILAALVVFCLIFQRAGYVLSGIIVTTAALRAFKVGWLFSLAVATVSVVATYLVFATLLGLALPRGSWLP